MRAGSHRRTGRQSQAEGEHAWNGSYRCFLRCTPAQGIRACADRLEIAEQRSHDWLLRRV